MQFDEAVRRFRTIRKNSLRSLDSTVVRNCSDGGRENVLRSDSEDLLLAHEQAYSTEDFRECSKMLSILSDQGQNNINGTRSNLHEDITRFLKERRGIQYGHAGTLKQELNQMNGIKSYLTRQCNTIFKLQHRIFEEARAAYSLLAGLEKELIDKV